MNTSQPAPSAADKHILIAADESENARRAVLYVADFLGGFPGFRVTLLNIIAEQPEDYFETEKERIDWVKDRSAAAAEALENYRRILVQSGFAEEKVAIRVVVKDCPTVAQCILDEQRELNCCTVVVGRRGISKREEFIFGSTSNKILHADKHCSVWIVE